MPLSDREEQALAEVVSALRPEWGARNVRAYLHRTQRQRTMQDLAFALVAVCLDERAETPAAVEQLTPWRVAAAARRAIDGSSGGGAEPGEPRCARPGHEAEPARGCRACSAELKTGTPHDGVPMVPKRVEELPPLPGHCPECGRRQLAVGPPVHRGGCPLMGVEVGVDRVRGGA